MARVLCVLISRKAHRPVCALWARETDATLCTRVQTQFRVKLIAFCALCVCCSRAECVFRVCGVCEVHASLSVGGQQGRQQVLKVFLSNCQCKMAHHLTSKSCALPCTRPEPCSHELKAGLCAG